MLQAVAICDAVDNVISKKLADDCYTYFEYDAANRTTPTVFRVWNAMGTSK